MIIVISSCGLCQQTLDLPDTKEPTVEIITDEDNADRGVLLYKSLPVEVDNFVEEQKEEVCEFEVERYTSETIEIKRNAVQGVYVNLNEEFKEKILYWARTKARQSKYVFVKDNLLYVAAGSPLNFIDWAIVDIDNQDILWGEDFFEYGKRMNFDGTINLREYFTEQEIIFNVEGRGKSPGQRTHVGFYIDFLFLSNCEET